MRQDKREMELSGKKLLDTVTVTFSGCGNLQQLNLDIPEAEGVKLFSPDVKNTLKAGKNGYCGTKSFKFMVKGTEKGKTSLSWKPLEFFDPAKGYYKLSPSKVMVNVESVSLAEKASSLNRETRFEMLKELPGGITVRNLSPITERGWFRLLLAIPLMGLILSILIRISIELRRNRIAGTSYRMSTFESRFDNAGDTASLLNTFYEALSEVHGINFKGERSRDLEKRYGRDLESIAQFIKELQYMSYSGGAETDLKNLKKRALKIFREAGKLK